MPQAPVSPAGKKISNVVVFVCMYFLLQLTGYMYVR